jgi:hypothetical protein
MPFSRLAQFLPGGSYHRALPCATRWHRQDYNKFIDSVSNKRVSSGPVDLKNLPNSGNVLMLSGPRATARVY